MHTKLGEWNWNLNFRLLRPSVEAFSYIIRVASLLILPKNSEKWATGRTSTLVRQRRCNGRGWGTTDLPVRQGSRPGAALSQGNQSCIRSLRSDPYLESHQNLPALPGSWYLEASLGLSTDDFFPGVTALSYPMASFIPIVQGRVSSLGRAYASDGTCIRAYALMVLSIPGFEVQFKQMTELWQTSVSYWENRHQQFLEGGS